MDIGGTTFTSALCESGFNQLGISMESYIKEYGSKTDLISGFTSQLKRLCSEHNISMDEIIGLGISAPGPLDSR